MNAQRLSLSARCIAMCVSMLMVAACSTVPVPTPTVALPANLLAPPPELPPIPRNADGSIDGRQCLIGALDLYAAAGAIRLQLLGLIAAEKARREAAGKR